MSEESPIQIIYDGTDISSIVKTVNWSGDTQKPYRELDVNIINVKNEKEKEKIKDIEKGKELVFNYGDEGMLFRGVIFATDINLTGGMSITAYDENVYLTKNNDTKKILNLTASDLTNKLAGEFGIPVGGVDDTGYKIPKKIWENETLWGMIKDVLKETEKHTGKKYVVYNEEGLLYLKDRRERVVEKLFETSKNIIDASYSQNIEEHRNKVKVIASNKNEEDEEFYDYEGSKYTEPITKTGLVEEKENGGLVGDYGSMQHLEQVDEDKTGSEVKEIAKELLEELATIDDDARISCIGVPEVTTGKNIFVNETLTEIKGGYYVASDSHFFKGHNHTMDLEIKADEELPQVEL